MRWFFYSLNEFTLQKPRLLIFFFLSLGGLAWACPFSPVDRLCTTSLLLSLPLFTWSPTFLDLLTPKCECLLLSWIHGTELDDFNTCLTSFFVIPSTLNLSNFTITGSLDNILMIWFLQRLHSLLFSPYHSGLHHYTDIEPSIISRHSLFTDCFPLFWKICWYLFIFFFIRAHGHYRCFNNPRLAVSIRYTWTYIQLDNSVEFI